MNWNKFLPCILFGSLLGACSGKGEQPKVEPTTLCLTDSLLRIVSVDTVHVCEVVDELTLNGRVTFNQDQVANVYPMFGGTVTELRAEIGDFVHKGEVLAVIRSGEGTWMPHRICTLPAWHRIKMYFRPSRNWQLRKRKKDESKKYSPFITSPEMLFISSNLPYQALLWKSRLAGICSCAPTRGMRCLRFPVCPMYG